MYVDGDWVKARGATLGSDNGIGVANIMTVLSSTHGWKTSAGGSRSKDLLRLTKRLA